MIDMGMVDEIERCYAVLSARGRVPIGGNHRSQCRRRFEA